ncbi:MAG: Asp-tRNA(Asn)/Glu-tRNA(Gln) amidotransferase subunit GatC [Anaerolineales bacterium]|nr:Asp-tRNA(Asn)/Glu-tRNA(Gln) amidotransferase subunit GatC [Anaerolineales bacterium]
MSLSPEDVDHIALLARLHLSHEEKERYRRQLSDILKHVDKLQELDTTNVQPMSSVAVPQSRLRPDEPGPGMPRADLLRNAPDTAEDQFRVPPVLDGGP